MSSFKVDFVLDYWLGNCIVWIVVMVLLLSWYLLLVFDGAFRLQSTLQSGLFVSS